jgi:hypothetical protein
MVPVLDQGFEEDDEFLREHLMDSVVHQLLVMLRRLCFTPVSGASRNGFVALARAPIAVTTA